MSSEAKECNRLLAALEDLAAQEAVSLAAGDIATLQHLQQRADPIIARLGQFGPETGQAWQSRLAAWLARRHETARLLATRIASTKAAIDRIDASRRRAARIGPAYVSGDAATRRLNAVG